jgi:hypothetical protein
MDDENIPLQIIDEVKNLVNQLPSVSYGGNAIPYLNLNSFGSGQAGYDALKAAFNGVDLSKALESIELNKKIDKQKKEIKALEKSHTNLIAIIGEKSGIDEASIAHKLIINLQSSIEDLIARRDELKNEVEKKELQLDKIIETQRVKKVTLDSKYLTNETKLEADYKKKEESLDLLYKVKESELQISHKKSVDDANNKIAVAESNANNQVKIIKQFSDFLAETNKNMGLYFWVIFFLSIGVAVTISLSIPDLLKCFESYDKFVISLGVKANSWQIINYAFGVLVVKLPWALCLSAVLTGLYKLLKGLLITYEKINQDKRNMSAIYAISGNVAQSLNEYGIAVAIDGLEDTDTGEEYAQIKVTKKGLEQKRESLRWNQIMNYFERMQQTKEEVSAPEDDPSKLKLVTDLLNKVIEKVPTAK